MLLIDEVAIEGGPTGGGVAQLEALDGGGLKLAIDREVLEGSGSLGLVEGVAVKLGRNRQNLVELLPER